MKKLSTILLLLFAFTLFPINLVKAEDLSSRLSGKILLQVEDKGQAWYIDPVNKERAYLGRPDDAFKIMRELGLGISESDYGKFKNGASKTLAGRILLRVQAKGEAYYVFPDNLKLYYLGRPADAFKVMREKGLGITDEDLLKVPVFQKYMEQTAANTNAINSLTQTVEEQQSKINELEEKINTNTSTSSESCTVDTWSCGNWGTCSSNNQQTRVCNLTNDCPGANTASPALTQACNSDQPTCTSWTYSDWSACSSGNQQTRTVISSLPAGCVGGSPITSQSCSTNAPTCTSWTYSAWSTCSSAGTQTRSVLSANPSNCVGGSPVLSQSCTSLVAPTVNLSSDKTTVYNGESATLTWSSSGADSCTASGRWSGTKASNGSENVVVGWNESETQDYKLTCSNQAGSTTKTITIRSLYNLVIVRNNESFVSERMGTYYFYAQDKDIVIKNITVRFTRTYSDENEFTLRLYGPDVYYGSEQICNSEKCYVNFDGLNINIAANNHKEIGVEYNGNFVGGDDVAKYIVDAVEAQLSSGEAISSDTILLQK